MARTGLNPDQARRAACMHTREGSAELQQEILFESALLSRIAETGAVVSELPSGSALTKWRFLMRNRLIAATTKATVVVEAGWRSGSLNVAGHVVALGRPLGAVPGPVTSAASAGCHRLIREYGATIITNADDAAAL